jgi:hypothetical protein
MSLNVSNEIVATGAHDPLNMFVILGVLCGIAFLAMVLMYLKNVIGG